MLVVDLAGIWGAAIIFSGALDAATIVSGRLGTTIVGSSVLLDIVVSYFFFRTSGMMKFCLINTRQYMFS